MVECTDRAHVYMITHGAIKCGDRPECFAKPVGIGEMLWDVPQLERVVREAGVTPHPVNL